MINHMNKHINRLTLDTVLGIEKVEHGLSKKPTKNELLLMESAEHKLKRKPTLRELMKFETKEHLRPEADEEDEEDDLEEDDDEETQGKRIMKRGSKC